MKTKIFRMVLFVALVFGLFGPSTIVHASPTTWTVTNLTDTNDGVCDSNCSLREAISVALSGDTIVFASSARGTILLGSMLSVVKSITISGPGISALAISGNDVTQVFNISDLSTDVNISNLTITHGRVVDGYGAGIYTQNNSLTLDHVAVTNNTVVSSINPNVEGGGIFNNSNTLTITNSIIAYNTANYSGGGIYKNYGASLSLTNVVVDHNQSLTGVGGGLWIPNIDTNPVDTVTLNNVSVTNNSAYCSGGGIFLEDSATISNSLIANNATTASGSSASCTNGGGLYMADASGGGQPVTISLTNVTVSGNNSGHYGGGIAAYFVLPLSSIAINNVTIANNQAPDSTYGDGGGIYAVGTKYIDFENTIISGNTSGAGFFPDCWGNLNSLDYNLIENTTGCTLSGTTTHNIPAGISPNLGALANNGGFSQTMTPRAGSPVIDTGNNATCAATDQRGILRPADGDNNGSIICDMGALEVDYRLFLPLILR
jgi:CSLREA domain-containing protein